MNEYIDKLYLDMKNELIEELHKDHPDFSDEDIQKLYEPTDDPITKYVQHSEDADMGDYDNLIQDRMFMEYSIGWNLLMKVTESDHDGLTDSDNANEFGGYHNEIFDIRPYYYDTFYDEKQKVIPQRNFEFRPDGLEMTWYKYPWRSASSNKEISRRYIEDVYRRCIESVLAKNKA